MTEFLAGVGARDITPEPGLALWGYMDRQGPATGVLDPLMAQAVVFRANDRTAALVSADLGRPPLDDVLDAIRESARKRGVDFLFFAATHTHHAPEMDVPDAPHAEAVQRGVVEAIGEALGRLQPAKLGVGAATFDIAHNRRRIQEDGRCAMIWRNEERRPTGPVDREATLIKLENGEGRMQATLVHFACHPVVMGPSNRAYSADYVGELRRLVEAETGCPCLFLQGACGDINPYLDKTSVNEGGIEAARQVGAECAQAVLEALPGVETSTPSPAAVAFSRKDIPVGVRWDLGDPAQREMVYHAHGGAGGLFGRYLDAATSDLSVPLSLLLLNDCLAFVGMPGEFFVRYQLELKTKAPACCALLCGYTDGYHAYFPTVRDALAGGYGGTTASYVGLGAADRLMLDAQLGLAALRQGADAACCPDDFAVREWDWIT